MPNTTSGPRLVRTPNDHQFRSFIHDLNGVAIFTMDADGCITSWNAGVERYLGYSESEFVGRSVSMIFTAEDISQGVPERERKIAERNGSSPDAHWHQRKDGTRLFIDGVITAMRNGSGELVGFFKMMRDSTERKLAEDALRRSNRELSEFAYMLSHDLQAPLRAVSIYSELLVQKYAGEGATDLVRVIRNAVHQMRALIDGVLEYSGIAEAESADVELESALDMALVSIGPVLSESGAVVTHDPLPVVAGHATQCYQLFENLLENAIRYRGCEHPRVHVSASRRGPREWLISVRDNGIGIDTKYAGLIFEPFKRLHGSELPGTGVGLAI